MFSRSLNDISTSGDGFVVTSSFGFTVCTFSCSDWLKVVKEEHIFVSVFPNRFTVQNIAAQYAAVPDTKWRSLTHVQSSRSCASVSSGSVLLLLMLHIVLLMVHIVLLMVHIVSFCESFGTKSLTSYLCHSIANPTVVSLLHFMNRIVEVKLHSLTLALDGC